MFVANPNKQEPIKNILLRNQEKLVEFLTNFHTDRSDDEQFNDEKAYLIKQIRELKPAAGSETDIAAPAADEWWCNIYCTSVTTVYPSWAEVLETTLCFKP